MLKIGDKVEWTSGGTTKVGWCCGLFPPASALYEKISPGFIRGRGLVARVTM